MERPILFIDSMVRATLEGRKTQDRRASGLEYVNSYPGRLTGNSDLGPLGYRGLETSDYYIKDKRDYARDPGVYHWFLGQNGNELNPIPVKCPYGKPGDSLWVRETWGGIFKNEDGLALQWKDVKKEYRTKENLYGEIFYKADPAYVDDPEYNGCWVPSIFMPRWASRITLRVVKVRVERLQDISEQDAIAEGIKQDAKGFWLPGGYDNAPVLAYRDLWDSINGKSHPWNSNPFVWVIEFEKGL